MVKIFTNYAYVSSYFSFKSYAWKRDWTISLKPQWLRLSARPVFQSPYGVLHVALIEVNRFFLTAIEFYATNAL